MKRSVKAKEQKYCYLMYDGKYYKIGESRNPKKRLKELHTANPSLVLICYTKKVSEKQMHSLMAHKRHKGEFFHFTEGQAKRVVEFMRGDINNLDHNWIKKMRYQSGKIRKYEKDYQHYRMPFGKYKGEKLCEIDDDGYLAWLSNNITRKPDLMRLLKYKFSVSKNIEPYQREAGFIK